eukprot:366526-Chlamydomonas_euryale.AAC.2
MPSTSCSCGGGVGTECGDRVRGVWTPCGRAPSAGASTCAGACPSCRPPLAAAARGVGTECGDRV